MADEIAKQVLAIIAEQASVETEVISPDSTPEELGIDSLGIVEAIFAIEETFDISVPFNANDPSASEFDISSVDSIIEAVRELIQQSSS